MRQDKTDDIDRQPRGLVQLGVDADVVVAVAGAKVKTVPSRFDRIEELLRSLKTVSSETFFSRPLASKNKKKNKKSILIKFEKNQK